MEDLKTNSLRQSDWQLMRTARCWSGSALHQCQVHGSRFRVKTPNPQSRTPNFSLVSYTPPHLAERIRAAVVTDGDRKTITALFADLKGSTALIEGLDPEEALVIIDPAL